MDDITVKEYFLLPTENRLEYEAVLKHLKPVNKLGEGSINFNRLTYKNVQICQKLLKTGTTIKQLETLFCTAYFINSHSFWKASIQDFFAAQNNLVTMFFNMEQREVKLLTSNDEDSHFWEMAGGEKLNKYSTISPLVQLGEIFGLWPFDLELKPYNQIMVLLVNHKEKSEVQREFTRLRMKHKPKGS